MIWANPWAWLGLLTLAVPILVHLLARRTARVQRFPTLRFLEASRLLPRRHTRLTDLPLLLLRLSVIAVAVAALARPVLLTGNRTQRLERQLARVILIDTSISMKRRTASGQSALEQARSRARERAAEAHTSLVIESAAPAGQLLGAAAWLETRPGRREIGILSDFQAGTLDESAIQALPADVGLRLDPIEVLTTAEPIEIQTRTGFTTTTARASLTPDRTSVEWRLEAAPRSESAQLLQLAAPADSARIGAALEAALSSGPPPTDSAHRVAIVYPTHDARAQLMQDVDPVNRPWMGELAMALADDTLVTRVGRTTINAFEHLVLFSNAAPGSLASAETMASVLRALSPTVPVSELEPASIPIEVLQRWERAPPTVVDQTVRDDDASDGRWLWAVVLLLIGVETIVRRAPRKAAEPLTPEAAYDRVA